MSRSWSAIALGVSLFGLCACSTAGQDDGAATSPASEDDDTSNDDDTSASDDDTADDDTSDDDATEGDDDTSTSDDDVSDDDATNSDDDVSDDDATTGDDDASDDDAPSDDDDLNSEDAGPSSSVDAGPDHDASSDPTEGPEPTPTGMCECRPAPNPDVCECSGCEEAVEVSSAFHVADPIDRGDEVPAGGDHNPCWGNWGVQDDPLSADRFVHNMEHGGVVLMYHCPDGCPDEVARMTEFVEQRELTILTEYAPMAARFAIASWGYRLSADCLDMDAVAAFYDAHVDRAPEQFGRPPPGPPAGCE